MEVEFELRAEDLQSLAPPHQSGDLGKFWRTTLLLFLGLAVPGILPSLALGYLTAALLLLATLAGYWLYALWSDRQAPASTPFAPLRTRIRLTPAYLEADYGVSRFRLAWGSLRDVYQTEDLILFAFPESGADYVPARIFATPEERDRFFQLARQYFEAAQGQPYPEIGLYDDDLFAPWTRSAGLKIDYQTTAAEWAYVERNPWTDEGYASPLHRILGTALLYLLALASFGIGILLTVSDHALGEEHRLGIGVVLYLGGFFWFFACKFAYSLYQERCRASEVTPIKLTKRTLFVSPDGLVGLLPFGVVCQPWRNYAAILENESWIAPQHWNGSLGALVPKSAFPSRGASDLFVREAQTWHYASLLQPEESADAEPVMAEARNENPFRSPHS